jgi:hypothetical protein
VYGTRIPAWVADVRSEGLAPFDAVTWIGDASDGMLPSLERLLPRTDSVDRAIAARVTTGDRTAVLLVRPGAPTFRQTREAELPDYQSNARVVHYASRAGTLVSLDLIDGSHARASRDGWLSAAADGPIAELHIGLEDGTMDLRASDPPPRLRFEGDAIAGLRTIRLNGIEQRTVPSRFAAPLIVDADQWAANGGVPLATLPNHRR